MYTFLVVAAVFRASPFLVAAGLRAPSEEGLSPGRSLPGVNPAPLFSYIINITAKKPKKNLPARGRDVVGDFFFPPDPPIKRLPVKTSHLIRRRVPYSFGGDLLFFPTSLGSHADIPSPLIQIFSPHAGGLLR